MSEDGSASGEIGNENRLLFIGAVRDRKYVNIYDFRTVLRHGRVARDRGTSRGRSERRNLTVILNLILTEAYISTIYLLLTSFKSRP